MVPALLVGIVLGLAGGGFAAHRWLTGEHLFVGPGASEILSLPAGQTIYVGLGPLPTDTNPNATIRVDLQSVHPLVTSNTSDATVTILTCIQGTTPTSLLAGGTALDPHPYCGSVESFRAGTITLGAPASGLLLAVTPHHAGTVEVVGAHINYRVGIRSGSQNIGTASLTANTP